MQNVNNVVGEIFVVDAPGGTGKTFLRKLIQAANRHTVIYSSKRGHACDVYDHPHEWHHKHYDVT
jgi:translation initiation factor 2B subunit (eIF-2B alpha/beta/delta family)